MQTNASYLVKKETKYGWFLKRKKENCDSFSMIVLKGSKFKKITRSSPVRRPIAIQHWSNIAIHNTSILWTFWGLFVLSYFRKIKPLIQTHASMQKHHGLLLKKKKRKHMFGKLETKATFPKFDNFLNRYDTSPEAVLANHSVDFSEEN